MKTPEFLRSQEIDESGRQKINWWKVFLLFIGVFGIIMFIIMLISGMGKEKVEKVKEEAVSSWKGPEISFDNEAKADEPQTENSVAQSTEAQVSDERSEKKEPDPRVEILAKLGSERFTPFQMDHDKVTKFQEFSKVSGGSSGCNILPGTIAKLRLDSAVNTDNGGVATAVLTEPVPGPGGCMALDMGAKFTGIIDTAVEFGMSRANIKFVSITTSDGRSIGIDGMAGDSMSGGGIPGEVNRHMPSKIAGVAIATAVDLAGFALAGSNKGFGIIVGNTGSVLDDFARQFVNRKNTITRDPTQEPGLITVTFTEEVAL